MILRIKNTRLTLQIIGWLQLIGGIFGFGLLAYLMLNTGAINGPVFFIFCVGILLFGYSIYCGKRLIFDEEKTSSIIYSIINQFLQLFQWSILGYGISYVSGAAITIGINRGILNFTFGATTANFTMSINSDIEFIIKLNLLALFVILILFSVLKEIKMSKSIDKENIISTELSGM